MYRFFNKWLLLLSFAVFAGAVGAQTVDSNKTLDPIYNESKGKTIYFVSPMMTVAEDAGIEVYVINDGKKKIMPSALVQMVIYFEVPGKKRAVPESVTIAINSGHYYSYQYAEHRNLAVTTDSGTVDLGPMNLTGRKDHGHTVWGTLRYMETLELPVTLDRYREIIGSKKVSMQVGGRSVSLTDQQLKKLRSLADKYLK
jgi:hypothetical protein